MLQLVRRDPDGVKQIGEAVLEEILRLSQRRDRQGPSRTVRDQTRNVGALRGLEVRPEAEQRWSEVIAAKSTYSVDASRNCTPGAFNNENTYDEGQPSVFATAYGGGPIEYLELLNTWRTESVEEDLLLSVTPRESRG